jgi:hypothetical protein
MRDGRLLPRDIQRTSSPQFHGSAKWKFLLMNRSTYRIISFARLSIDTSQEGEKP